MRFRPLLIVAILVLAGCTATEATPEVTPFDTVTPLPTFTPIPSIAPLPTQPLFTPTATIEPSPTSLPWQIVDAYGEPMAIVPEGEFIQGSDTGFPDEVPVRTVWVDTFYLDLYEVTNSDYARCVDDGVCHPPRRTDCCTEQPGAPIAFPDYYANPDFADYPVIFISWFDAQAYCTWRGARLATEAEWEKASRGVDGRTYPWGDDEPRPDLLNFTWPEVEFEEKPLYTTSPVGSYPLGVSPYGIFDLAGNVYEWVEDRYAADYYTYAPLENPSGPDDGTFRVTRGGSFFNQAFRNRSSNRNNAYIPAESVHFDGGARCAADVPGS